MKFRDAPIRHKLMNVVLITSGAVLILTCAAFFTYEFFSFRETTRSEVQTLGEIIATNSTAALAFDDPEDAREILGALKAEKHIVAACLYDTLGNIFSKYPFESSNVIFPVRAGDSGYNFRNNYLEGFQPVTVGNIQLGTLYLKSNMNAMYDRFKLYSMIVAIVICVSFLLAYLLSRRLQKIISQPVLALAETAKIISEQKNYAVRATKYGEDETGIMTDAFNHMLSQIEFQNLEILSLNQNLEQKVQDRTLELQKSNEELQQQKDFVETILDSSLDLIIVYDKETRILSFNKTCEDLHHLKREEVLGKKLLEIFPGAEGTQGHLDVLKGLQGQFIHNSEYLSPLTHRYYENFIVPLRDLNNDVYAVLVTAHDTTIIVRASDELKRINAALEKSNYELEQFAYIASHDLQEPVRKIQTFSDLAHHSTDQATTEKYLEKIKACAKRMTELINSILNYSRLSRDEEQFTEVDLNTTFENVKIDLELLVEEKNAIIESSPLPVLRGVPLQLSQLFFNLIGNSLKFSDGRPVIRISSKKCKASNIENFTSTLDGHEFFELKFEDNGIGFEQKYADKIFTIFQRLHRRQQYGGTGIGLALCKKVVENHHGYIAVESKPGKGTIFYIYLPA